MAKLTLSLYQEKKRVKRKGVHSKCKSSNLIGSKLYKKKYKGQGR